MATSKQGKESKPLHPDAIDSGIGSDLNLEQMEQEKSKDLSNPDGKRTRTINPNPSHRMNILNAIVKESREGILPEAVWPHLLKAWMVILEGEPEEQTALPITGGTTTEE